MVDQFMYIPNINTQMKRLNIKLNEPNNQNRMKVPKASKLMNKKKLL